MWCPLDAESNSSGRPCSSGGGINAVSESGETPVGVAAAAVLAASPGASSATAAAAAADQELLALLLSQKPFVSQELGARLLQAGLSGQLSDKLLSQVSGANTQPVVPHNLCVAQSQELSALHCSTSEVAS